jgi:integrase/recombinase XerD
LFPFVNDRENLADYPTLDPGLLQHDLRHTYAVRVLNKWVRDGKNLTTALPYLAIYMGHEGLKACQHYLRLTAVMFPELIRTVEKEYGWIIPEAYHE